MIIAGGGTGGHLFPGLAVAEEMKRRDSGSEIVFVTGRKSIESTILDRYGFLLRGASIIQFTWLAFSVYEKSSG